jgi:predicted membrane chloride channel (bestrophin family)
MVVRDKPGISLSIFLGFRNNACYDRWWKARKLWGQLIHELRSLARVANTLLAAEPATARRPAARQAARRRATALPLEWMSPAERRGDVHGVAGADGAAARSSLSLSA